MELSEQISRLLFSKLNTSLETKADTVVKTPRHSFQKSVGDCGESAMEPAWKQFEPLAIDIANLVEASDLVTGLRAQLATSRARTNDLEAERSNRDKHLPKLYPG